MTAGADTIYLYDGWRCIEERECDENEAGTEDDAWEPRRQYVYGGIYIDHAAARLRQASEPLIFDKDSVGGDGICDNARYFYCQQANYNVVALADSTGASVQTVLYDPYGQATLSGNTGNPYLFQSQRWDTDAGMYYFRNRWYHPVLGRFMQRDPAGYVDGNSLSQFEGGSPVGRTDANWWPSKEWASDGFGGWPNYPTPPGDRPDCAPNCRVPYQGQPLRSTGALEAGIEEEIRMKADCSPLAMSGDVNVAAVAVAILLFVGACGDSRSVNRPGAVSELRFVPQEYQAATSQLSALKQGAHTLPNGMAHLSMNAVVYVTENKTQGKIMLFVLWRGKSSNIRGAMHVSSEFDINSLARDYDGIRVLRLIGPVAAGPPGAVYDPLIEVRVDKELCPGWYYVIRDAD